MFQLARIISNALNPLVIFVLIVTSVIYYTTGSIASSAKWFIAAGILAFISTIIILLAVKMHIFSNFDVSQKKDRPILFLGAGIVALVLIILGFIFQVEQKILTFFIVGLLGIFVYSLVNKKIKASVHMGVYIIFVSILTFLFDYRFLILFIGMPILAWARVTEREHTIPEVVVGSVLGILLSVCLLFLLQ